MKKNNIFTLSSPHTCFHCCGSTYLRILEEAADTLTAEEAIQTVVFRLSILGEKRREYAIKKLAEQFQRLADFPPNTTPSLAARGPQNGVVKPGLRPDFSPHPTHQSCAVSSGAVAPSEGTPCTSERSESQGSQEHSHKAWEGH
jgi:hypothetical protein